MTSGTGYFSTDKKNTPLRNCYSIIPNYERTKTGTDIFILGFHKSNDWQTEIITSLLEEFLIAIYNNELQIKVCDTVIKADNLYEIIEAYKENAKIAYNYYQVLTDDKAVVYEENIEDLGKAELRVLVKPELHRKIMMCRKNGMKIFDKANISGTIPFVGICILKDDKINEYFREMENPQHNAWEPERHTSDTKTSAKRNMSALYKFVKNKVIELGKRTTIDKMDAEGMGEYFTDAETIDENAHDKSEIVSADTNDIEIEVDTQLPENIGYEQLKDNDKNEIQDEERSSPGRGNISTTRNPNTNPFSIDFNIPDNADKEEQRATRIDIMSVRLFLADPPENLYALIFIPQKSSGKGYLQISMSGEQGDIGATIIIAYDGKEGKVIPCKNDKIFLDHIVCGKKIKFGLKSDIQKNALWR